MIEETEALRQDTRGRVRTPRKRREALLDEFAWSGLSGAKFARLVGFKDPTFAAWVQQRRQQGATLGTPRAEGAEVAGRVPALHWFEAVVDSGRDAVRGAVPVEGLRIELPGGCGLRLESPAQLPLVAELIALVAKHGGARC